jgi:hypothetical protein
MIHGSWKSLLLARHRWLMPVTLATQEAEIRRIEVLSSNPSTAKKPK